MIQEKYCGLKEHQIGTSVCVMENCYYQSRLFCKMCNSKHYHNHNQKTNTHLLDLEIILKNQEASKDQSFQYHSKMLNFNQMLNIIQACKSQLDNLASILLKQKENYKHYIENLQMIQIHLDSKEFLIKIDNKLAQIIKQVNDFTKDQYEYQALNQVNDIMKQINNLNECIQNKGDKTSDNKLLQVVNHKYQIQFAQISPNNKDLLFGSNGKLFSYNFEKFNYQLICNISDITHSFIISKDYQQFYFDQMGTMKIYNKNLKKCESIKLQTGKIEFIRVLSKVLAAVYFEQSQLYIINLKLKKIIFKFYFDYVIDMLYIEAENLLIIAQPYKVDTMTLNYKFKSQKLDYYNNRIVNIQFNSQNQQLIILDTKGILTFWNLKNGQFFENLFQINIQERYISYFIYNQYQQQYIVFTASELIFYNIQGQIIKHLSHSYKFLGKKKNLEYQVNFSNQYQELIIFRTNNSITLLRLGQV